MEDENVMDGVFGRQSRKVSVSREAHFTCQDGLLALS